MLSMDMLGAVLAKIQYVWKIICYSIYTFTRKHFTQEARVKLCHKLNHTLQDILRCLRPPGDSNSSSNSMDTAERGGSYIYDESVQATPRGLYVVSNETNTYIYYTNTCMKENERGCRIDVTTLSPTITPRSSLNTEDM